MSKLTLNFLIQVSSIRKLKLLYSSQIDTAGSWIDLYYVLIAYIVVTTEQIDRVKLCKLLNIQ